jgi:hypothetical protein
MLLLYRVPSMLLRGELIEIWSPFLISLSKCSK